jgi:hypothetical protein
LQELEFDQEQSYTTASASLLFQLSGPISAGGDALADSERLNEK